ncbi:MAG: 30S ribosomal protein S6--L-glutamate ligase [Gammaproteobacteria bacterium]|nr:30S ribosomal protein S6--L-glutamate ligase [Gammaproteobacteria bacterium]
MRIAVLSNSSRLYSTKRLVVAGRERGHRMRVISYSRCYMNVTAEQPQVHYKGAILKPFDAVIPRISASLSDYGVAVVRQFQMLNSYCVNKPDAISCAHDKFRVLQLLAKKGIALPTTGFARSAFDVDDLIQTVGGAPFIIKLPQGSHGAGVALAETHKAAESVLTAFVGINANILIQEFIEESRGKDVRCFVIGDEVVAAMERSSTDDDFRSNLHRGGTARKVRLTKALRETALSAARLVGLNVCGVDVLMSNRGPMVLEVNASPGLEGIERVTGVNVADKMIEFIEVTHAENKNQASSA